MRFIRELDIIGGYHVDSVSPSKIEDEFTWPDGFQETIAFTANPTEAVHNEFKVRLYFRGTPEWEEVQQKRAEIRQEIDEIRVDAETEVKARVESAAAEIQETQDVTLANDEKDEPDKEIVLKDCEKDAPHVHCEIEGRAYGCLQEDGQPRHFGGQGPRTGHYRSKGHMTELEASRAAA